MKNIVSSSLYLVTLLCLSVFLFDRSNLYYELPWLDIPMHIMGGIGVSAFVLAIASYRNKSLSLHQLLLLYTCIAVAWELWEVVQDISSSSPWNGWADTTGDFINGLIGAIGAFYFFKK